LGNVTGKSVILTGGAGDIAKVVAAKLVAAGARVLLVDLDESNLQQTVATLASDNVSCCVADVTSEEDTQRYVATAVERYGGVDVLLANAGIEGTVCPVSEYDKAMFEKVMAVNVTGPFLGIKHVFPIMAANGGGSIVITSSIAGLTGAPNISAYGTSKHAVIGLMRSCAKEGGALNIRVNTVNPAPVEGRMISSLEAGFLPDAPEVAKEGMTSSVPLGRYAVPEDVANLMLFLASEESSYLTGGIYSVDGGMSAG
jgi:NAD(P)-dependent dehydrogenase (short-subunit alcohol dehydrogenase family)